MGLEISAVRFRWWEGNGLLGERRRLACPLELSDTASAILVDLEGSFPFLMYEDFGSWFGYALLLQTS